MHLIDSYEMLLGFLFVYFVKQLLSNFVYLFLIKFHNTEVVEVFSLLNVASLTKKMQEEFSRKIFRINLRHLN